MRKLHFIQVLLYSNSIAQTTKSIVHNHIYSKFFVLVVLCDLHNNLVRQIQRHWQLTKQSLLVKDKFKVHICKLIAAGFTLQKLCRCMSSKVLFAVFLFKTLWVLKKINPSSKSLLCFLAHKSRGFNGWDWHSRWHNLLFFQGLSEKTVTG